VLTGIQDGENAGVWVGRQVIDVRLVLPAQDGIYSVDQKLVLDDDVGDIKQLIWVKDLVIFTCLLFGIPDLGFDSLHGGLIFLPFEDQLKLLQFLVRLLIVGLYLLGLLFHIGELVLKYLKEAFDGLFPLLIRYFLILLG